MSMKDYIAMFPGQGSQFVGMGRELSSMIENILIKSRGTPGLPSDLLDVMLSGPEEKLAQTLYTQPAVFLVSSVLFQSWMKSGGGTPVALGGHSLGEYAAVVAGGGATIEEGLRLVCQRAEWMTQLSAKKCLGMNACIGLERHEVEEVLTNITLPNLPSMESEFVSVATINSKRQIVIGGTKQTLVLASEKLLKNGAKRVIPLNVSSAFHTQAMLAAQSKVQGYFKSNPLGPIKTKVIASFDGELLNTSGRIEDLLVQQCVREVNFPAMVKAADDLSENIVEFGARCPLSGLCRRNAYSGQVFKVDSLETIASTRTMLQHNEVRAR